MTRAAVVLAGGRSTRMGRPKAMLEWHGSTLLRRAVGIVGRAVDGPVVVVHAAGQDLPPLPDGVELARDARPQRGPLEAIAAGLARVGDRADAVFVAAVDAPLLHPALVAHVLAALAADDELDVALPHAHGHDQPLAAAYRTTTVLPHLHAALAADELGTRALFERARVRRLDERALLADPAVAALDPRLDSLRSLNDPQAYERARAAPAPAVTVTGRGTVRAATLAQAGDARAAAINGRPASDPQEPLAAGDVVSFL